MELREVIEPHYSDFSKRVVDPVSLASRLDCLIDYDRDQVQCTTNSSGRLRGAMKLYDVIIGKVTWPELHAALRKENLTELAKTLEEEYYQQHPMARPNPQDENLNSGVDLFQQEPTDSCSDSHTNDSANSNPYINLAEACFNACTSSNIKANLLKNTQIVCIQIGNNNCIKTGPCVESNDTTAHTDNEEQYQVSVECSVSRNLDKNESQENILNDNSPITVQYGGLPKEPTVPQNVSPQFSSSSSDSQDGGSPKVRCHNETAEHTLQKVVFEEVNGSALSDNISSQDNTSIQSESHGHNKISDMSCVEKLRIELRTGVRRCGEGEEKEETELKEVV